MDNKAESDAAEKNTSKRFTTWLGAITVAMSILAGVVTYFSYHLARQAHYYEQETSRRRFILDTLKEMQQVQDELRRVQSKNVNEDNLSEREILLLNYYEVLSKTLADNINKDPSLLLRAQCNHPDSVRIRKKPSGLSEQIGGIEKDDYVTVLGTFTRGEEHKWYYVITGDNKIGWGYKYFTIAQ